jgi:hypothetical protein|tara:strand:- start:4411 stop:4800 length:390 start_codon:yes stop_codon:yes gene_type:complete
MVKMEKKEQNKNITGTKRKAGRPKGSVTNKQRKGAYDILRRNFSYALEEMSSRKNKPQLHELINDALTNDIRDISKFAFLFPQQSQLNIKADSLVKSISTISERIKNYKREDIKKGDVIDVTPKEIDGD